MVGCGRMVQRLDLLRVRRRLSWWLRASRTGAQHNRRRPSVPPGAIPPSARFGRAPEAGCTPCAPRSSGARVPRASPPGRMALGDDRGTLRFDAASDEEPLRVDSRATCPRRRSSGLRGPCLRSGRSTLSVLRVSIQRTRAGAPCCFCLAPANHRDSVGDGRRSRQLRAAARYGVDRNYSRSRPSLT